MRDQHTAASPREDIAYLTDWDECPVGCGMGMVFLKCIGTEKPIVYCHACELACDKMPARGPLNEIRIGHEVAPRGATFATRAEIESAQWTQYIKDTCPQSQVEDSLWHLHALALIDSGQYDEALTLLTKVITEWYGPPAAATYRLRAQVYRRLGDEAKATFDDAAAARCERDRSDPC